MRRSRIALRQWVFPLCLLVLLPLSCGRRDQPVAKKGSPPAIASLVPAATDLLLGMGAADHLVAISNFDIARPEVKGLARVGDYENIDWEKLSALRPDVLIVQMSPERLPAGLRQRAEGLGAKLVNIQIEQAEDIFAAIRTLGELSNESAKADALSKRLRRELSDVEARVASREPVATLIVISADGQSVIGSRTFLDDMLQMAHGRNVAGHMTMRYPTIDREMLLAMRPEAIVQVLPEASPQVLQQARQFWATMGDVPAVRNGRVYEVTEWHALLPGSHVGELTRKLAGLLHPEHPQTRGAP